MSRNAALITGAGLSTRMDSGEKKEYRLLEGIPVLAKSMLAFQNTTLFSETVVTVPPGQMEQARRLVASFCELEGVSFIEGGVTRRDSVFLGLSALEGKDIDYVLIHDAARPWISPALIRTVLEGVKQHGAVIPTIEITDAVVETGPDRRIRRHLTKQQFRGVQTPQGFRFQEIFKAHQAVRADTAGYYDDAQVLMNSGHDVFYIAGDPVNRKITYSHDLEDK